MKTLQRICIVIGIGFTALFILMLVTHTPEDSKLVILDPDEWAHIEMTEENVIEVPTWTPVTIIYEDGYYDKLIIHEKDGTQTIVEVAKVIEFLKLIGAIDEKDTDNSGDSGAGGSYSDADLAGEGLQGKES